MLDALGNWQVASAAAVGALVVWLLSGGWLAWNLWRRSSGPGSKGLLPDLRTARALVMLHVERVEDQIDDATDAAAKLGERGTSLQRSTSDLQRDVAQLRLLLEELPRARARLRQSLIETLVGL